MITGSLSLSSTQVRHLCAASAPGQTNYNETSQWSGTPFIATTTLSRCATAYTKNICVLAPLHTIVLALRAANANVNHPANTMVPPFMPVAAQEGP